MKAQHKPVTVAGRMSIEFQTVRPDDYLGTVIGLLKRRDIRSVPVVEDGKLVRIVTDRDIRQVAPPYMLFKDADDVRRYMEGLKVTAAMTANPLCVAPDTSLIEAAKILETYKISSLPVVAGEKLVGMLSVTDLLGAFIEQNEARLA
jgi:acetoin utilization protein AcuB